MAIDPRTPVIVGVAQLNRRVADPADGAEPVLLMADALQAAEADASVSPRSLIARLQSIRVPGIMSWRYADPGRALAARVGADPAETLTTTNGGNSPQWLLNLTAALIQRGDLDVAAIVGAESMHSRLRARAAGIRLPWTPLAAEIANAIGDPRPGNNDAEGSVGLVAPPVVYPVLENAWRAACHHTIDEHQRVITQLWSRFSEVAARNEAAWSPQARTADELRAIGPDNRMVGFPYPKLLNANLQVDQAAALIICSVATARAVGVPVDRWVFPLAGADAHDQFWVSERLSLTDSPAIATAGRAALAAAGVAHVDDIDLVDLYSCFPAAVETGAAALGLPLDDDARPLTLTGGLTFAGGPGNNYVTHSIATLVARLRRAGAKGGRGRVTGLITGLGWYATKHSVGVYSNEPPTSRFVHVDPTVTQRAIDVLPRRRFLEAAPEKATAALETYTVTHERDGTPARAIAACLLADGTRCWAATDDADVAHALTTTDGLIGTAVHLRPGGRLALPDGVG